MASQSGVFPALFLSPDQAIYPQHNTQSANPGLPVAEDVILYQGTMVAMDENGHLIPADPSMSALSRVVGVTEVTVDNRGGDAGAKVASPRAGVVRLKHDGSLTGENLFRLVGLSDDHTVIDAVVNSSVRWAGILLGIEGDYAWVLIQPASAALAPGAVATVATANASDLATAIALTNALKTALNAVIGALNVRGIVAPAA
jgi:hypothetical protein